MAIFFSSADDCRWPKFHFNKQGKNVFVIRNFSCFVNFAFLQHFVIIFIIFVHFFMIFWSLFLFFPLFCVFDFPFFCRLLIFHTKRETGTSPFLCSFYLSVKMLYANRPQIKLRMSLKWPLESGLRPKSVLWA